MTKRDFEVIAAAISVAANAAASKREQAIVKKAAEEIADALKRENPRFKPELFLNVCGV